MTLDDLLRRVRLNRRLGAFAGVLRLSPRYIPLDPDEGMQGEIERMIRTITQEERRHPERVGGERVARIAEDSGTSPESVAKFLRGFELLRGAA